MGDTDDGAGGSSTAAFSSQYKKAPTITTTTAAMNHQSYTFGLFAPMPQQAEQSTHLIIYAHPNAADMGLMRDWIVYVGRQLQMDVLLFEYRGYGQCPGKPEDFECLLDAAAAWNFATTVLNVKPERIILWGRSVGSGILSQFVAQCLENDFSAQGQRPPPAAVPPPSASSPASSSRSQPFPAAPLRHYIERHHHLPGLLFLECPFSSIRDCVRNIATGVAKSPKVAAIATACVADRFPTKTYIQQIACPILILHGREDTLVPYRQGAHLFALARNRGAPSWTGGVEGAARASVARGIGFCATAQPSRPAAVRVPAGAARENDEDDDAAVETVMVSVHPLRPRSTFTHFIPIDGIGHNDIPVQSEIKALSEALARLGMLTDGNPFAAAATTVMTAQESSPHRSEDLESHDVRRAVALAEASVASSIPDVNLTVGRLAKYYPPTGRWIQPSMAPGVRRTSQDTASRALALASCSFSQMRPLALARMPTLHHIVDRSLWTFLKAATTPTGRGASATRGDGSHRTGGGGGGGVVPLSITRLPSTYSAWIAESSGSTTTRVQSLAEMGDFFSFEAPPQRLSSSLNRPLATTTTTASERPPSLTPSPRHFRHCLKMSMVHFVNIFGELYRRWRRLQRGYNAHVGVSQRAMNSLRYLSNMASGGVGNLDTSMATTVVASCLGGWSALASRWTTGAANAAIAASAVPVAGCPPKLEPSMSTASDAEGLRPNNHRRAAQDTIHDDEDRLPLSGGRAGNGAAANNALADCVSVSTAGAVFDACLALFGCPTAVYEWTMPPAEKGGAAPAASFLQVFGAVYEEASSATVPADAAAESFMLRGHHFEAIWEQLWASSALPSSGECRSATASWSQGAQAAPRLVVDFHGRLRQLILDHVTDLVTAEERREDAVDLRSRPGGPPHGGDDERHPHRGAPLPFVGEKLADAIQLESERLLLAIGCSRRNKPLWNAVWHKVPLNPLTASQAASSSIPNWSAQLHALLRSASGGCDDGGGSNRTVSAACCDLLGRQLKEHNWERLFFDPSSSSSSPSTTVSAGQLSLLNVWSFALRCGENGGPPPFSSALGIFDDDGHDDPQVDAAANGAVDVRRSFSSEEERRAKEGDCVVS